MLPQIFQMLMYFIRIAFWNTFINHNKCHQTILCVENTSCLRWQMQVFQSTNLNLSSHFIFDNRYVLPLNHFLHFENSYQISSEQSLLIIVSKCFSWCNYCILVRKQKCVMCISHFITWNIKKQWLKKINIYCCIRIFVETIFNFFYI